AGAFLEKATREAKVHTSWVDPVPGYDEAVQAFVRGVLGDRAFVSELERFLGSQGMVRLGRINALTQTTLLLTCPGVPDLYQGTELWELSLVDPDNRRPVDYAARAALLDGLGSAPPAPDPVADEVGASKLWLVTRLLEHRRREPGTYA